MIQVEVAIWKFGVKITSSILLYFFQWCYRRNKRILLFLTFDKRRTNCPKVSLCLVLSFWDRYLILYWEVIFLIDWAGWRDIANYIWIFSLFLTTFYVIPMLIFRFFFCESASLVSKQFESLVLFVRFYVAFYLNIAESLILFHDEDVISYFSQSGNVAIFCCLKQVIKWPFILVWS